MVDCTKSNICQRYFLYHVHRATEFKIIFFLCFIQSTAALWECISCVLYFISEISISNAPPNTLRDHIRLCSYILLSVVVLFMSWAELRSDVDMIWDLMTQSISLKAKNISQYSYSTRQVNFAQRDLERAPDPQHYQRQLYCRHWVNLDRERRRCWGEGKKYFEYLFHFCCRHMSIKVLICVFLNGWHSCE